MHLKEVIQVNSILANRTLLCCAVAWMTAQLAKYLIDRIRHKGRGLRHLLFGLGGMPSSHTAFVGALCTMVAFKDGLDSTSFAICFVLAFIVMTDAIGVRRETGRQGSAINILMDWFTMEHDNVEDSADLKERVGHSPLEVLIGLLWGIGCGLLFSL